MTGIYLQVNEITSTEDVLVRKKTEMAQFQTEYAEAERKYKEAVEKLKRESEEITGLLKVRAYYVAERTDGGGGE